MTFASRLPWAILTVVIYAGAGWGLMWDLARRHRRVMHLPPRPHTPDEWTRACVQAVLAVGWGSLWPGGPLWLLLWAWWYTKRWNQPAPPSR